MLRKAMSLFFGNNDKPDKVRHYDLGLFAKAEWLPLMSGSSILSSLGLEGQINDIKLRTRTTDEFFKDAYYMPILRLAEAAQLSPASESYHHYELGGFLTHTLEVVEFALGEREKYSLPEGGTVEQQTMDSHRWTYVVFVCALLHDVGKLITQHKLNLSEGGVFTPYSRFHDFIDPSNPDKETDFRYSVKFDHDRKYESHQYMGLAFLGEFFSHKELIWLASDTWAFNSVVDYLSNESGDSDAVKKIIKSADMRSTGAYIQRSDKSPFVGSVASKQEQIWRQVRGLLQDEIAMGRYNKTGSMLQLDGDYIFINIEILRVAYAGLNNISLPADGTKEKDIFANRILEDFSNTGQFVFFYNEKKGGHGIITSVRYFDPHNPKGQVWRGQIVIKKESVLGLGNNDSRHPTLTHVSKGERYIYPFESEILISEYSHWRKSTFSGDGNFAREMDLSEHGHRYYLENYVIGQLAVSNKKEEGDISKGKEEVEALLKDKGDRVAISSGGEEEAIDAETSQDAVGAETSQDAVDAETSQDAVDAETSQDAVGAETSQDDVALPFMQTSSGKNMYSYESSSGKESVKKEGVSSTKKTKDKTESKVDLGIVDGIKVNPVKDVAKKDSEKKPNLSLLKMGMSLVKETQSSDQDLGEDHVEQKNLKPDHPNRGELSLDEMQIEAKSPAPIKRAKPTTPKKEVSASIPETEKVEVQKRVLEKPTEKVGSNTEKERGDNKGASKQRNPANNKTRSRGKKDNNRDVDILSFFDSQENSDSDLRQSYAETLKEGGLLSQGILTNDVDPVVVAKASQKAENDFKATDPKSQFKKDFEVLDSTMELEQDELKRRKKVVFDASIQKEIDAVVYELIESERYTYGDLSASLKNRGLELMAVYPYNKDEKDRRFGIDGVNEHGDTVKKIYAWDVIPLPALPENPSADDYGECFIQWLALTIFSRKYEVNRSRSPIHKIGGQYLSLTTPMLFLEFLADYGLYKVPQEMDKGGRNDYNKAISRQVRLGMTKLQVGGKDLVKSKSSSNQRKEHIFGVHSGNNETLFSAVILDIPLFVEKISGMGISGFLNNSFGGVVESLDSNKTLFIGDGIRQD